MKTTRIAVLTALTLIGSLATAVSPASASDKGTQYITGRIFLSNVNSGKCANVEGGSTADSARVIQWPCGSTLPNDQWWLDYQGTGSLGPSHQLINAHSGKCLNVEGASVDNSAAIIQWPCGSPVPNDVWAVEFLPNGYVHLINLRSGKCLNVEGGSTADGVRLIQWTCGLPTSLPNDQWRLIYL